MSSLAQKTPQCSNCPDSASFTATINSREIALCLRCATEVSAGFGGRVETRPIPKPLLHSLDHKTLWVRSQYDLSCPRCSVINKFIHLKRRNVMNGATLNESLSAQSLAARLCEKYTLTSAEQLDRLYTSPTQSPSAQAEKVRKRRERRNDPAKEI